MSLVTGACSTLRFGYNQAADLAYWWLDGYVDFNDAQTVLARNAIATWFVWHRSTQLPVYAKLLVSAENEVVTDSTPGQVCVWWDTLSTSLQTSLERAVPAASELVLSISPAQIEHIERRYAKANAEFRDEYLQSDPLKRRRESIRRATERAELLYGKMQEAQREQIARLVARSPFDPELWFNERRRRQQDALQILRRVAADGLGPEQVQAALRGYLERSRQSPKDDYRQHSETLTAFNCALAATLHNSTDPAQRQSAVQKLKGWESDLRSLSADVLR